MTPTLLFYIIIGILVINYSIQEILNGLNSKHFNNKIPDELEDVYDKENYKKSQAYKKINHKFSLLTNTFSLLITISFYFVDGFRIVDDFVRNYSSHSIVIALLFFGCIIFANSLLNLPFSYYKIFVIEEKFGFNKATKKTFFLDLIKSGILTIVLGGAILALIVFFYQQFTETFWIYAWLAIGVFSVLINLFYAQIFVPLFNKQTSLEKGPLKDEIEKYAETVNFRINNIFVIDGSKRSTKANAYFSGFGNQKRITLYDTLINDLETNEIVAVLAHEVGHYRKKHILYNLLISILITGITLYLLSLCIQSSLLSNALGISVPSFHIGLIAFGILYLPISEFTNLCMNYMSRKFEYQADNFAKETYSAAPLISALKKLSKNSLSNLTPHSWYVSMYYSHPTLLNRIKNLKK
ncbi:M48 family metallopeptidase [Polaribacter tangerinus]|uniref:M48 family metallopeptidase n=1 Tax=Polaribacter tangerinus TaxID=1920034 RepID=UPI000B4B025D|nr:M48 family metallopeptidase [Polaribacter tangerinus]